MIFQLVDLVLTFVLNFLLFFGVAFIVSIFIINWDPRTQLVKVKYTIYIISTFISILFIIIPLPDVITGNFWIFILIYCFIAAIVSIVVKYITFKLVRIDRFSQFSALERDKNLLETKNLKVYYPLVGGILKRKIGAVKAVDGVSFDVKFGETIGLVGESGCGKTTIAKAILGLVGKTEGEILFQDKAIPRNYTYYLRQKIQMIFQDPDASLNPRKKVVDIIADPLKNLLGITNKLEIRKRVLDLLNQVSMKR